MYRLLAIFATLAMLTVSSASPAAAQDYPFQGIASDVAVNTLHNALLNASVQSAEDGASAPEDESVLTTTYEASAAVSAKAEGQFLEFVRQTIGEAGAVALANEFKKIDPAELWAELVAANDLEPGDAADAIAGYWILNWVIANAAHETEFPTAPIVEQVRASLARDLTFRDLNEAERQELSEVLMMNFLVQYAVYDNAVAGGDAQMIQKLGDAAVARFKSEAGIDLRGIAPTRVGFAQR